MRNRSAPDHRRPSERLNLSVPSRHAEIGREDSPSTTPSLPGTVLTSSKAERYRQELLFRYIAPTHAPRSRNGLSFSGSRTNLLCLLAIQLRQRCQHLLGFLRIAVFPICSR